MPFKTIYTDTRDLSGVDPHYPEPGREIPWAFGMANRKWDTLMEEHPQYEKYKMYVVPFWAGILFEAPHRLRSLTISEMVASVEGIIKTRWVLEDLIEKQRIQEWSQDPIRTGLSDRVQGTIDEIPDEYSLPDFVVPPVIQKFLDKREVQQSTDSVAFVVR